MTHSQRPSAPRRLAQRRAFTFIDLVVLICCLGLGILVGCYTGGRSRETANIAKALNANN